MVTLDRAAGSGLGLAIAKFLVELMKGDLLVDSVLGKGTRFQFVLELAPAAVGEGAGSSESCEESAKSPQQHRLRLLVVDDVELNRELTLAMLGSGGHMVDLACNGKEALEFLNRYSYDLVLMDVRCRSWTDWQPRARSGRTRR